MHSRTRSNARQVHTFFRWWYWLLFLLLGVFFLGIWVVLLLLLFFLRKEKKCDKIWRLYAQKCRLTHRTTQAAGKGKIDTRAGIYNSREHIHNGTFSSHSRLAVSLERSLERLCRSQTTLKKKGGRCKATKAFFRFRIRGKEMYGSTKGKLGNRKYRQVYIMCVCVCTYMYTKRKTQRGRPAHTTNRWVQNGDSFRNVFDGSPI